MSRPRSHPNTARTRRKTITLTNSERLNAKSVKVNAHPKVNAYKLWSFTLSFHRQAAFTAHPYPGKIDFRDGERGGETFPIPRHASPDPTSACPIPPERLTDAPRAIEQLCRVQLANFAGYNSRTLQGATRELCWCNSRTSLVQLPDITSARLACHFKSRCSSALGASLDRSRDFP